MSDHERTMARRRKLVADIRREVAEYRERLKGSAMSENETTWKINNVRWVPMRWLHGAVGRIAANGWTLTDLNWQCVTDGSMVIELVWSRDVIRRVVVTGEGGNVRIFRVLKETGWREKLLMAWLWLWKEREHDERSRDSSDV